MNFLALYDKPGLIAAHRGARSIAPENTLRALKAAAGKCDFLEIDVQLSRDGVPVIMHDETLERTTDVREVFAGRAPWRVEAFSFEELSRLDYGSWFYRDDPFGTLKSGRAPVPKEGDAYAPLLTLEEALRFVRENDLYVNVEIKDMRGSFDDHFVVERVLKIIGSTQSQSRVLLSSFAHVYLPLCKALAPQIPTAALQEGEHPAHLCELLNALNADAYHCDDAIADEGTLRKVRENGYFTGVYTVNEKERQEELFSWGVNAVFSDRVL